MRAERGSERSASAAPERGPREAVGASPGGLAAAGSRLDVEQDAGIHRVGRLPDRRCEDRIQIEFPDGGEVLDQSRDPLENLLHSVLIHGAFSENLPTCILKFIPLHTPAVTMSFNTQLADIAAKGRPGSGFVPVGAAA